MPAGDGTGPFGLGPGTGRGLGPCGGGYRRGWAGRGFGRGRGFGWGRGWFGRGRAWSAEDEKAALDQEEQFLKEELARVQAARASLEKEETE
jgi:hypothetical protein